MYGCVSALAYMCQSVLCVLLNVSICTCVWNNLSPFAPSCNAVLIDGTCDVALSDLEATIWVEIQQRMHQMQQMSTEAR